MKVRNKQKEFVIIGAGRVGTQLALRLHAKGMRISSIMSRTYTHAESLANRVGAVAVRTLSEVPRHHEAVIMLSVSDTMILPVAEDLKALNCASLVVHTSGAFRLESLAKVFPRCGNFYPLMTFHTQAQTDWKQIPIGVAATRENDYVFLCKLAKRLGGTAFDLLDDQRTGLHISAVFANNFTNYLLGVAFRILEENQMPKSLLQPLIERTAQQLKHFNPEEVQTGPATRGDLQTIQTHTEYLKKHPKYAEIYKLLSEAIKNQKK